MFLAPETFKTIVGATPLISIDLVVQNSHGEILLGRRNNRPAKDYWFVPGGRILKNEKMDDAFVRLCKEELGVGCTIDQGKFLGPYEHFYEDSVFGEEVSTHYVVLAYALELEMEVSNLPAAQHNEFMFMPIEAATKSENVHIHSKWYLKTLSN